MLIAVSDIRPCELHVRQRTLLIPSMLSPVSFSPILDYGASKATQFKCSVSRPIYTVKTSVLLHVYSKACRDTDDFDINFDTTPH